MIFHIATQAEWAAALVEGGDYRPASLASEGFSHCSTDTQLAGTLAKWFPRREDVVLLRLDPAPFGDQLVFEGGSLGESEHFPHIYGPIPIGAVIEVIPVALGADGVHVVPASG
jgi:uncharacterized protein (DUF952 family)